MLPVGAPQLILALALQGSAADGDVRILGSDVALPAQKGERRVTLDVINDGIATVYDEGYSSGLRVLARTGPWSSSLALGPRLGRHARSIVAEYWTLGLAHEIWTPADLTASEVYQLDDDRPYAGLLSVEGQVDIVMRGAPLVGNYSRASARLMVGVTGDWSGSAAIQRYWHARVRSIIGADFPRDPRGWGTYEIPETVLANLRFGLETELVRLSSPGAWGRMMGAPLGLRTSVRADCDVGTFRVGCESGFALRVGWLPELTFDGATPIIEGAAPTPVPMSAHLFVGSRVGAIAFDALLDGPIGTDSPSIAKRIVRARLEFGLLVQIWATEFSYVFIIETNELSPVPYWAQAYQRMGHIRLSYRW